MSLVQRVLDNLKERREKVLEGGINCIPSPFTTFTGDFPGIEQGKFYLVSGSSKSGKSQLTNYLFMYTPIFYAYEHPDKLRVRIFYFPLEETPEKITMRFMCHLLYVMSGKQIRVDTLQLNSTDRNHILDSTVLDILNSIEYRSILNFYEEHVHFITEGNPTGAWRTINRYAEEAGTIHKKLVTIENKETGVKQEREVFDYYKPKDPNEYVIIIWDHASLTSGERGISLKERIDKLCEYFMIFRNRFNYTPVLIQQQNMETIDLNAFKAKKIAPTLAGLSDSKDPGKACSMMLGITNPYAFELPEYKGWDITKLQGYARFLEVVLHREGESNGLLALYFDGATNYFEPLPHYTNTAALNRIYKLIEYNRNNSSK